MPVRRLLALRRPLSLLHIPPMLLPSLLPVLLLKLLVLLPQLLA
jgi:hypothetical protein